LVAMLCGLFVPVLNAESGSDHPFQGLAGEWAGTINGTFQGGCRQAKGTVQKATLTIEIDDDGRFIATSEEWPFLQFEGMSLNSIIGQVDENMRITAAQSFVFTSVDGDKSLESVIRWTGEIRGLQAG